MTISVDGHGLTIEYVVQRRPRPGVRSPSTRRRKSASIKCRALLEDKIQKTRDHVRRQYGHRRAGQRRPDARNRSRSTSGTSSTATPRAYGKPLPEEIVRAAMLSRISCHCHGHSGLRLDRHRDAGRACSTRASRPSCARRARSAPAATSSPMSQIALGPDGRGRGLLQGRAPARPPRPSSRAGIRPVVLRGPRRAGHDQRLQRHRRARRPSTILDVRPLAQARPRSPRP